MKGYQKDSNHNHTVAGRASIFVTCLIDNFFPEVAESMVSVLENIGIEPHFLSEQTCCGQPAFNSGYWEEAREVGKKFLETFKEEEIIICPSGSCTTMLKVFYQELFKGDPEYSEYAKKVSARTFEFTDFLVNRMGITDVGASCRAKVTYHDSCHTLRELGIKDEPRILIRSVKGVELLEMDMNEACCGFGGTFSIKFPHISLAILEEKIKSVVKSGAKIVVSTDMGCLMNIKGYVEKNKLDIKTLHISQLLAMKEEV